MKQCIVLVVALLCGQFVWAQQKPTDLDKSPLDVSYLPANYPILKMSGKTNGQPVARILYSRPQKKGRDIFGGEVKFNELWRIGANETTEVEFFRNVVLGGKKVPKGRYSLYCIPTADKWTLILNKDLYSWGSFTYSSTNDVARVEAPVLKTPEEVEALTMYFENGANNRLNIMWDNSMVAVPLSLQ